MKYENDVYGARYTNALELWVDLEKQAYLIPDPYGEGSEDDCFAVHVKGDVQRHPAALPSPKRSETGQ